jgi:hypothetical protein
MAADSATEPDDSETESESDSEESTGSLTDITRGD